MSLFFISVVSMVVVLGIMILVHEFGHYAAAKLLGVRVEVFSIGFGPRLVGFRRGDTDYRISSIPLGGYVKMSGENPMDARTGDQREFMSHPRWHRFIIAVAGPAMNILLAVALLTGVYMVHYEHPAFLDQPAVVGWVVPNSPAAKADIQPGDRIVRVNNSQNPNWEDVMLKAMLSPNQPLSVAVQRDGQILSKQLTPQAVGRDQVGDTGLVADQPNVVTEVERDMPAAKAGIKPGDVITAVNGQSVRSIPAMIHYIQENKDKSLDVTVLRKDQTLTLKMNAAATQSDGETVYRIGIRSDPVHVDKLPFPQALSRSVEQNEKYSTLIIELFEKMVARKVSMRQIEGPIGIAKASGEAARQGTMPLLALMAAISLNLGIFNLFPIPIMDGGVILLLAIESIMRRDISQAVKERIYQVAFVFLLFVAVMVIYNDIAKLVPGLSGRLP
jgi:regulator of sigma E protease